MNVKFLYTRLNGIPVATLAYTVVGDLTPDQIQDVGVVEVNVGIAICHDNDQFVKSVGRAKAEGRLRSVSPAHARFRSTLKVPAPTEGKPGSAPWWKAFEQNLREEVDVWLEEEVSEAA